MSSLLQRAAEATACNMLGDIASASTQLAAWTMFTPKVSLVPLTVGGLSYMANQLLCNEMDFPDNGNDDRINGCKKIANGYGVLEQKLPGGDFMPGTPGASDVVELVSVYGLKKAGNLWRWDIDYINTNGDEVTTYVGSTSDKALAEEQEFRINPTVGDCAEAVDPDDKGDPYPDFEPYEYNDPVTNCNYTLKLQGFIQQSQDGPIQPVYEISSSGSQRSGGGRMGGCNLSPTIIVHDYSGGGGDNPPPQIPVPPTPPVPGPDGQPWWLQPLITTITTTLLNQILNALTDTNQTPMAAGSFTLTAPCDVDAEGKALQSTWTFDEQPWYQRVHDQQVVIMDILQQHLDWKTPICREQRPEKRGTWISTHWRSDADSPNSNRPLRKLFRYRSESTRTNNELQTYWSDFEWTSGPVCVIHKGAWWGTPQVWASTAEEGQRVIRRAGAEAGLNPDQTGEWLISRSDSPRYGMSRQMRLDETSGERWVTRREGPSGFPEL